MKIVATKNEYAVLELEDRWEVYNTVTDIVVDTVWRDKNKDFLYAIVDKWGYDEMEPPVEIEDYDDIVPDMEALMLDEEEVKEARKKAQEKMANSKPVMEEDEEDNVEKAIKGLKDVKNMVRKVTRSNKGFSILNPPEE